MQISVGNQFQLLLMTCPQRILLLFLSISSMIVRLSFRFCVSLFPCRGATVTSDLGLSRILFLLFAFQSNYLFKKTILMRSTLLATLLAVL